MDEEAKAIWYVLRELLRESEDDARRIPPGFDLARSFTLLDQVALERRMRHGVNRAFRQGEMILLRLPSRDARVAAVSCLRDVDRGGAAWRFYLGMWLRDESFVGIRFEPPGDSDSHSYYHSQLCSTMGDKSGIAGALAVPERYPAWPLPAASSLELLLCLVVSIHGRADFNDLRGRIKADRAMQQNRLLVKALDEVASRLTARAVEPSAVSGLVEPSGSGGLTT